MHTIKSVCPYCAVGCGLIVEVEDGIAGAVRGDPDHPANFGHLCSKGALLPQMLRTPDRLLYAQIREDRGQGFRRVGWDEALDFMAARVRRIIGTRGPDAFAVYGSGQLPTEDYYLLGKLTKGFLGTNNQDTNSRLCMTSAAAAYTMAFGKDGPPAAHEDIDEAECFLILGANMAACHPVLFQRVRERKRQSQRVTIIVVDPRRTATGSIADIHLPVRPGTDVALLNAMLHVILVEGLVDEDYVASHTEGFEALRDLVLAEYAPEDVAPVCGVDTASIRKAALAFGRSRASLSLWAMGANQSTSGVDKNLALINLSLVTGHIGRPGAGPFSLTGQPNAMGGREAGGLSHTLPGHRIVANAGHRNQMEKFWRAPSGRISSTTGLTAVEIFDAMAAGEVTGLWVICTNPMASMPNLNRVREALLATELVVVQDAYHPTETSRYAHVLLPAAQWSEREGTMTNGERRVCYLEKAGDPPGEALPDWQIISRFAAKMGFGSRFTYAGSAEIFEEFVKTTEGQDLDMTGLSYRRLRGRGGIQWPAPVANTAGTVRLYADGRFPTPSGRARLHAVSQRAPAEEADVQYPFVLMTGRVRDQWHTRTRTGKIDKLNRTCSQPYVEINHDDAAVLGIEPGATVEIRSRRGSARLPARLSHDVGTGTAFAPFHWGELWDRESSVNELLPPAFDPISKEPELKYCAVSLAPQAT